MSKKVKRDRMTIGKVKQIIFEDSGDQITFNIIDLKDNKKI